LRLAALWDRIRLTLGPASARRRIGVGPPSAHLDFLGKRIHKIMEWFGIRAMHEWTNNVFIWLLVSFPWWILYYIILYIYIYIFFLFKFSVFLHFSIFVFFYII